MFYTNFSKIKNLRKIKNLHKIKNLRKIKHLRKIKNLKNPRRRPIWRTCCETTVAIATILS